jgi:hypothetical protein
MIYGLTNCTSIKISTGLDLEAVLYAPQADLAMNGTAEFMGSLTVNALKMGGGTAFTTMKTWRISPSIAAM